MSTFKPIAINKNGVMLPYNEGQYIAATKPFTDGVKNYEPGLYVDMSGLRQQLTTQGPKGDQGEQGIQGERGLPGRQGDRGVQGVPGLRGERGERGQQGKQGIQGIQGERGAAGKDGTSFKIVQHITTVDELPVPNITYLGDAMSVGIDKPYDIYVCEYVDGAPTWLNHGTIQGPQGERGEQGAQGEQGIQGIQGDRGNGITGVTNVDYEDISDGHTKTNLLFETTDGSLPFSVFTQSSSGVNPFDYLITTQDELNNFITALYAMSSVEHLNVAIVEKDSEYILNSPLDFRGSTGHAAKHIEIIGIGNPILRVDYTDGSWTNEPGCLVFARDYISYDYANSTRDGLYETKIKNITVRIGENVKSDLAGFFAETSSDDIEYGGTDLFSIENCKVIINNIDRESYGFSGCANLVNCLVIFLTLSGDTQTAVEARSMFSSCYNLINCSVINITNGFEYCKNLTNCKVDTHNVSEIFSDAYSTVLVAFLDCENLTNCITNFNNSNYTGSSRIMIFDHCKNLSNCRFLGESMNINENNGFYIFSDCVALSNCSCYLENMGTIIPSAVFYNCSYCSSCEVNGSATLIWDGTTIKRDDSSCDIDE